MHATILKWSAILLRLEDVLIEGPDEAERPSNRGQLVRYVKRGYYTISDDPNPKKKRTSGKV